jgi:hypothetical protein
MAETIVKEPTKVERIITALDGRTQTWLVSKIKEFAETIEAEEDLEAKYKLSIYNDVTLSRKMNGKDDFEDYELKAIGKILKIKL